MRFLKKEILEKIFYGEIEFGHQDIYENQSVGKENQEQCFVTCEITGSANAD